MRQVHYSKILFKVFQLFRQPAFCIIDDTAAVKDDLRLRTDGIAVIHGKAVFQDVLPDDFFAVLIVVVIKGRSGNIDHQVRVLPHQLIHRADAVEWIVAEVPDVFTDGQGYFLSFERDNIPLVTGLEIAVFVKNIVIRQTGFMCNPFYLFLIEKPGGIEKVLPFPYRVAGGSANDDADGVRLLTDAVDSRITLCYKIFKFEEIPGRVSTKAQFRKDCQGAVRGFRMAETVAG